ncbi:MAG: TolC family protein [Bacteroidia bacterium]|jgi:outer membrane protein TolC|nr:TolC family protein [Bacteroidia bacterium]
MTTQTKWLAGLLLLLTTAGVLRAQPQPSGQSYSFSLQQAVDFAMSNQNTVRNAQLDEKAAAYKVKEIVGIGLPQVSGSFQFQDFVELPTSLLPAEIFGGPAGTFIPVQFGVKYNATAAFSGQQLLFSGSYFLGVQAAKVYQDLARKNTIRSRIEATADVTKAYYTVLVNKERKTRLEANLALLKKLMDDTKALNANGFVEKIDVDRATVSYNSLAIEVQNVQRLLDLGMVLLKYQMGMDQTATLELTDDLSKLTFSQPQPNMLKYTDRVEYQLLDLQLRGSLLSMRAERVGYLPTVAFFASLQAQAQRNTFDFFDNNSQRWFPIGIIGLQVNVPIFDGFQRHYRIQQARVSMMKAQNDMLFIQQTIDLQVASARVTLENSTATMDVRKANMDLAQGVYDVAKKKYEQGVGSNLEVMVAQTSLTDAQAEYFDAMYAAVIAKVDYDKAMGTLTR